jgi:diacylglycerol kinase (ATP)
MSIRDDAPEVAAPLEPAQSPFKGKTGLIRIVHAFFNSCAGLADAWRHESAFRQEILLAAILVPVALVIHASPVERALLIASVLLVTIVELLNTGVEVAIDRISFEHHSLSKRAKDIGSAAVFVALLLLGAVWAVILLPRLFPG